jgi:hypothetical protein
MSSETNDTPVYTKYSSVCDPGTIDIYKFLEDSLTGGGGYRNGDYLLPYSREAYDDYILRRAQSYYPNFYAPIVDSFRDPLFKNPPKRTGLLTENEIFQAFLRDVNGTGRSLDQFMKKAGRFSKAQEVVFIQIATPEEITAVNVQQQIERGEYPKAMIIKASQVEDWKTDMYGNITSFKYCYSTSESKNGVDTKKYITWTKESVSISGSKWDARPEVKANEIGVIPIVPYYSGDNEEGVLLPTPQLYGVARLNHRVYNMGSEITNLERDQTYSILVLPDNARGGVAVGANGYVTERQGDNIRFEAPDGQQLKNLYEGLGVHVNDMYTLARLSHLHRGESLNQSGESKKQDQEVTSNAIAGFSANTIWVEIMIGKIFSKWIKKPELANDYSVAYPKEFNLSSVQNSLENAMNLLTMNIGPTGNAEAKKDGYKSALPELDNDTKAIIDEEIEDMAREDAAMDSISTDISNADTGGE